MVLLWAGGEELRPWTWDPGVKEEERPGVGGVVLPCTAMGRGTAECEGVGMARG